MLEAYRERRWDEAAELNDANEQAATGYGLGKLIMVYRDRLVAFAAKAPPADWDGIFEAQTK